MPEKQKWLVQRAREMRKHLTPPELKLWRRLSGRGSEKLVFRRQHLVAGFIADFACVRARLIIEVDGLWAHIDRANYDADREAKLKKLGYEVLRVSASDVIRDPASVALGIFEVCKDRIARDVR